MSAGGHTQRDTTASLVARARQGDEAAITTMFGQFLRPDDRVVAAEYLGVQGLWGLGTRSFACLSSRQAATLRVGILGGIEYREAALEDITSGGIHQPSRLRLFAWVAVVLVFAFASFAPRMGIGVAFLVAASVTVLLLPLIVGLFYRRHKCGLELSVREGLDLYFFSDRKLLGRANAIYRLALAERERRVRPWLATTARPAAASAPSEPPRAIAPTATGRRSVPVAALVVAAAVLLLLGAGVGVASLVGGDDEETASTPTPAETEAPTPSTPEEPPASGLSDGEQALVAYAGDDVTGCRSADVSAGNLLRYGDALAGISCSVPGADVVHYFRYDDLDTMNDEFSAGTADLSPGEDCEQEWQIKLRWHYGDDKLVGRLACYDNSDGESVIEWTEDRERVLVYAWMVRADGSHAKLYEAWKVA